MGLVNKPLWPCRCDDEDPLSAARGDLAQTRLWRADVSDCNAEKNSTASGRELSMLAEASPRAELPIVARALGARHASPFGLLNHIVGKPQALRERLGVRRISQQLLLARRRSIGSGQKRSNGVIVRYYTDP